jgi:hypothetical protein
MAPDLMITLGTVFVAVALLCGTVAALYFGRSSVGRRLGTLTEPNPLHSVRFRDADPFRRL